MQNKQPQPTNVQDKQVQNLSDDDLDLLIEFLAEQLA